MKAQEWKWSSIGARKERDWRELLGGKVKNSKEEVVVSTKCET